MGHRRPLPARSGLRTLRPDQRGYAASARPTSTNDYRVVLLVADVVSLLDAAGGCWADPATPTGCGHCSSRSAPPAAVETAVRLMADRDRVRAMLQWYRAVARPVDLTARKHCTIPTTYVWSTKDAALGRAAAERTERYVDGR